MRRLLFTLALALSAVGVSAQRGAKPVAPSGGDHLMYIGTYAGNIQIFDEATETCSIMLRDEADALLSRQDGDDVDADDTRSYQLDDEPAEET